MKRARPAEAAGEELKMSTEKFVADTVRTTLKVAETAVKKAWTLMDAATQKERPSEALSPRAIQAIQGGAGSGGN